ncbi:MAG: LysE family translocator [Denitrovibrio sp.]|nr:MAG: LysE family translocator [Denitrovibrio sp.]
MDSLTYWILFLTASLALCISPGPDLIYIVSKTVAQGRKTGIFASAGVCSGALVHVTAAAFGLSAIMATSATAFNVIKYIGAAYLFYLGIKTLISKHQVTEITTIDRLSHWHTYRQGAFIDILNPKVAIFFMAFLPQFVRPEVGSQSLQILVLGFLVVTIGFIVEVLVVLATAKTTGLVKSNPKTSALLEKLLGVVFIGLGLRLVLSSQTK